MKLRLPTQPPLPQRADRRSSSPIEQEQRTDGHSDGSGTARLLYSQPLPEDLPPLVLPTDWRRPEKPGAVCAVKGIALDAALTRRLRSQISAMEGITLPTLLLSAVQLLLRRYAGQEDFVIGIRADKTMQAGARNTDPSSAWLPIRVRIAGQSSFRSHLQATQQTVSTALLRAELASRAGSGEREPAAASPVRVTFAMLQPVTDDTAETGHDLDFRACDHGDRIDIQITYSPQTFDARTIQHMAENLATLLTGLAEDPDRTMNDLDCIAPGQRQALLYGSNQTAVTFGPQQSIQQLFEDQVRRTPARTALYFGESAITYQTLNERANRLAHNLLWRGAKPGVRIGICVDRSFDTIIGLLGIIKTGATCVPLDSQHPAPRLKKIVQDCGVAVLVLHRHRDDFDDFAGAKIFIDGDMDSSSPESTRNPPAPDAPDRVLNIIYTSATTGKPKGVVISERAVLNRLHWMWTAYPFKPGDVALIQKSASLVASTWEFFGGLLQGIPSVILSFDQLLDPARLWATCDRHGVTHFLATPALIEGVLLQAERQPGGWPTLRFATTSAEPISPAMVRRWREAFPSVPLLNLYGATECASNATVFDTRELGANDTRVPVGKPLANVRTYVLDRNLQLLPQGAIGELCVSGACLAEGYLGLPDLTNERFVANPFPDDPNDRLYRTGDLARIRADGHLELIGRRDNQVNVRGFRVELEDIETILETHSAVKQAVVVLSDGLDERGALVAFIVPMKKDEAPLPANLRLYVEARLPSHMVPSQFAVIDRIPLTRQGKVDRLALRRRSSSLKTDRVYVAPRTKIEKRLAQLWEELLNVESVGLDDDFFDLGGHSLLAVHLFAEINRVFGCDLPLSTLYRSRTLQRLAAAVAENDHTAAWSVLTAITPRTESSPPALFCVHGIYGEVLFYRRLVDRLGRGQPLYGLQPPTLRGHPVYFRTVRDLAAQYVEAIKAVQPTGPYYLAGYSFGAKIALEMAQILTQQGNRPAFLVSLDGFAGGRVDMRTLHQETIGALTRTDERKPLQRMVHCLRSNALLWRTYMFCKALVSETALPVRQAYFALARPLPRRARMNYTVDVLTRIARGYRPLPYDGRTIVFSTALRREALAKDWLGVTGGKAEFISIHGTHNDIFEDCNLELITSFLNDELPTAGPAAPPYEDR